MDELIKRRDALEAIAQLALPYHIQRERILDALRTVPAADAVEVVHCKDCRWYQIRKFALDDIPEYDCRKRGCLLFVKPDDFCSYGERAAHE